MSGASHPSSPRPYTILDPPPIGPPPVDPVLHPVLHGIWSRITARGTPRRAEVVEVLEAQCGGRQAPAGGGGTALEASRNWSGARVVPIGGRPFHIAAAAWRAPALTPGASGGPPQHLPRRCAVWVGFGGHRRWSRALPQLGTLHTEGRPDRHLPFIQWWIRDNPRSGARILDGPAIRPGDTILVFLWLLSPDRAAFYFLNADLPGPPVAGCMNSPDRTVETAGVSAEWIVERPRDPQTRILHPLANFGTVELFDCAAGTAGLPERRADAGRLIRMDNPRELPNRTRWIAMPRRRDREYGGIEVTYRQAGP